LTQTDATLLKTLLIINEMQMNITQMDDSVEFGLVLGLDVTWGYFIYCICGIAVGLQNSYRSIIRTVRSELRTGTESGSPWYRDHIEIIPQSQSIHF